LSLLLPVATVRAQWTAEDSLRLQELLNSDKDIFINHELMSVDKPWMQFVNDLPLLYDDTTSYRRPQQIRLLPFSCFTRWNEDPFALQDKLSKEKNGRCIGKSTGAALSSTIPAMAFQSVWIPTWLPDTAQARA
jgi:hypothetical protein